MAGQIPWPQVGARPAWLGCARRYRVLDPEAATTSPRSSDGEGSSEVKKKLQRAVAEEKRQNPGATVEIWAMDEHRIGLKPITRGVWAPKGERPLALGHHRYEWLYVHGFVEPTTGRTSGMSQTLYARKCLRPCSPTSPSRS